MLAQNLSFKPCNLLLHFLNLRPTLKVLLAVSQSIDLFNGSKYNIGCSVAPSHQLIRRMRHTVMTFLQKKLPSEP